MCCFGCVFFLQAEDGIRDLVRSRGLGDVYKRQDGRGGEDAVEAGPHVDEGVGTEGKGGEEEESGKAVSYTHLTLPTSDLV